MIGEVDEVDTRSERAGVALKFYYCVTARILVDASDTKTLIVVFYVVGSIHRVLVVIHLYGVSRSHLRSLC